MRSQFYLCNTNVYRLTHFQFMQFHTYSIFFLLLLLLLKYYSLLWTLACNTALSIPSSLWPLHASFIFTLSSDPFQPYQSIFSLAFLFSVFLSFWHSVFVLAFFHYSSFHYVHTIFI